MRLIVPQPIQKAARRGGGIAFGHGLTAIQQRKFDQTGPNLAATEIIEFAVQKSGQGFRLPAFVIKAARQQRQKPVIAGAVKADLRQIGGGFGGKAPGIGDVAHHHLHDGLMQTDVEQQDRHLGATVVQPRPLRDFTALGKAAVADVELQHRVVKAAAQQIGVNGKFFQQAVDPAQQGFAEMHVLVDQHDQPQRPKFQ